MGCRMAQKRIRLEYEISAETEEDMKSTWKKVSAVVMMIALLSGVLTVPSQNVQAAFKKVSITRNAKVTVGKTVKIKLKNNKKKVTWKVTKGKKLIEITQKSKSYAKIRGIKTGTAKVQAVTGRKKYTCTVTVSVAKNKPTATSKPQVTNKPTSTEPNVPSADLTISSERELNEFAQKVNAGNDYEGKLIVLTEDIKYDGVTVNNFVPIGWESRQFLGTFDGCGHTISGIDVTSTSYYDDTGLFGYIGRSGVVKNVVLKDSSFFSSFSYDNHRGCLACVNYGIIDNCHERASSLSLGFVGENHGIIRNCSSTSDKILHSGHDSLGGIADFNGGTISNCCNIGNIQRDEGIAGGIAGENEGTIQNCYNTGLVQDGGKGGITGYNKSSAIVANCFCSEESSKSNFITMQGVEKNCKAYPLSEMQTETFVNLLNANRGNNTEWMEWSLPMGGDILLPMPGKTALTAVSATETPIPTVFPEATEVSE